MPTSAQSGELNLEEISERVIIRPMLTISQAIDLYVDGHLVDRGRAKRTRTSYGRILDKFADRSPRMWDVAKVTEEDCRAFMALYHGKSRGYRATVYAPLNGMFEFLVGAKFLKSSPMQYVPAPTRPRPEDIDVITVNPLDVPTLLRAARPGAERNCLFILAALGPRRHAAALLTLKDYDRRGGRLRFHEKGGKTIWKPVPEELRSVLDASIANGEISDEQPYLIPPEGKLSAKGERGERDDRIVWALVRRVAARCGIEAHTHALRRAFAVGYLLSNPGDSRGLQKLMGHRNPGTTELYLRALNDELAMEPVRSLSWLGNTPLDDSSESAGNVLSSSPDVGAGGFEPPKSDFPLSMLAGTQRRAKDRS